MFLTRENDMKFKVQGQGLEQWLGHEEHMLLFAEDSGLAASTTWLTTMSNFSSTGSNNLFWPPLQCVHCGMQAKHPYT